jgi:hypothetical protein
MSMPSLHWPQVSAIVPSASITAWALNRRQAARREESERRTAISE